MVYPIAYLCVAALSSFLNHATQGIADCGSVKSKLWLLLIWGDLSLLLNGGVEGGVHCVYKQHWYLGTEWRDGVAVDVLQQCRGETMWRHPQTYLLLPWAQGMPFLVMFAKLLKVTVSFIMSVCLSVLPHRTTRLPLDGFSWNLIFEYIYIYFFIKSVKKIQV